MNYTTYNVNRLNTEDVKILQVKKRIRNIDIARTTGVSAVEISRHINGDGRNQNVQKAIAKALSVPLDDILIVPELPKEEAA